MATPKKIKLNKYFKEFIELLNSHGVEYLLLGGYAVNYYGHHRSTGDIDFWFATKRENAEKLVRILEIWGFERGTVTEDDLLRPHFNHMFGVPPFRIDLLSGPTGVEFDACYARRIVDEIDGIQLPVISLDDLRGNKLASGRDKDIIDLKHLPERWPPG
jgi:hypothetical protein